VLIAFFVNDMEREHENFTTTVLAHAAVQRGHRVCYVTPADFVLHPDDCLSIHARFAAKKAPKTHSEFFAAMQKVGNRTETIEAADIDVLMLRSDPSLDAQSTPWAADIGILFGREAAKRGVLVVNDPDSLGRAVNKLYFQSFPEEVRAETLITKHPNDVKEFAKAQGGNVILKPLQGSGGSGVFKVDTDGSSNMNQIIEAIERDGYIIAQAYIPAASKGDIRSNIHAGGKAAKVKIGEKELRVAEIIRPKLIADGMFLVGIDIVGDKILEVNVFSPGNLKSIGEMNEADFTVPIIEALETKLKIAKDYKGAFDNCALATM
jgi:glutathione synthase